MSTAHYNNVYGHLRCTRGLEHLTDLLRYRLGLTLNQASVNVSQTDGTQMLRIESEAAEFEARKLAIEDDYSFVGAVNGSESEVIEYVNQLHTIFSQGGYQSSFEIYDENFNCIGAVSA